MTPAEILKLSETSHTPGLHRAGTLAENAKISLNDAVWYLSLQPNLRQITPYRYVCPETVGYQEEISA